MPDCRCSNHLDPALKGSTLPHDLGSGASPKLRRDPPQPATARPEVAGSGTGKPLPSLFVHYLLLTSPCLVFPFGRSTWLWMGRQRWQEGRTSMGRVATKEMELLLHPICPSPAASSRSSPTPGPSPSATPGTMPRYPPRPSRLSVRVSTTPSS